MRYNWTIRWQTYLAQLSLVCTGVIILFAACYWSADILNWGWLLDQEGHRETHFLDFLYFSIGTFFRIGYADQVPVGSIRWLLGFEAFSNYLIEILFVAQLVTSLMDSFVSFRVRERLDALLARRD